MLVNDLDYPYPTELIALQPSPPSRVAFVDPSGTTTEMSLRDLLDQFVNGDVLVINESKVIPARVFAWRDGGNSGVGGHGAQGIDGGGDSGDEVDILFLTPVAEDLDQWDVLFPAREFAIGDSLLLPGNLLMTLVEKGRPQRVKLSRHIDKDYFLKFGEMALPPYIQEARRQRHNRTEDQAWYQAAWARQPGSVAAPTASLHFQNSDLDKLRACGVSVVKVTLHVGAGTFLPITSQELKGHVMHREWVEIPHDTVATIRAAKARGAHVWALGTTVARALESHALGLFQDNATAGGEAAATNGPPKLSFTGVTNLFIYPPFQFQVVDRLLTNFHHPKSTLLALVMAFARGDIARVKGVYAWAIERRFRLFSYGDLSAWIRP